MASESPLVPQGWQASGTGEASDLPAPLQEALRYLVEAAAPIEEVVAVSAGEEAEITAIRVWATSLTSRVLRLLDEVQAEYPGTPVLGFRAPEPGADSPWEADRVAFVRLSA
ncbi:MAG: hypothetical protein ACOYEW_04035 [Anaerolineae bacterium]|jgi:hypothetical protein